MIPSTLSLPEPQTIETAAALSSERIDVPGAVSTPEQKVKSRLLQLKELFKDNLGVIIVWGGIIAPGGGTFLYHFGQEMEAANRERAQRIREARMHEKPRTASRQRVPDTRVGSVDTDSPDRTLE